MHDELTYSSDLRRIAGASPFTAHPVHGKQCSAKKLVLFTRTSVCLRSERDVGVVTFELSCGRVACYRLRRPSSAGRPARSSFNKSCITLCRTGLRDIPDFLGSTGGGDVRCPIDMPPS